MYCQHFGLRDQPFSLTPNTAYYLNAHGHRDAFNMLQVALANGEGFIKVVGEVGTGKTMLCRKLLSSLPEHFVSAYIPNPFLNPTALYRALAEELGLKAKTRDGVTEFHAAINERLLALAAEGKKVVLLIDEAQAMPAKTLEALRLLSNLETESSKLLHIVLFGQPELDELLAHGSLRQLRQRISFSYHLPPLDRGATSSYIAHRAITAGFSGGALFDAQAVDLAWRASGGVPRLINILCHKALMSAYGRGAPQVGRSHMQAAVRDTEDARAPGVRQWLQWGLPMAAATAAVLALFWLLPGGLL